MQILRRFVGEDVNDLEVERYMRKSNIFIIRSFPDKVTINLEVFGTFMKDRIGGNPNSIGVVSMKRSSINLRKDKFRKKSSKPNNLRAS